jgi:hypothetical protein
VYPQTNKQKKELIKSRRHLKIESSSHWCLCVKNGLPSLPKRNSDHQHHWQVQVNYRVIRTKSSLKQSWEHQGTCPTAQVFEM